MKLQEFMDIRTQAKLKLQEFMSVTLEQVQFSL